MSHPPIIYCRGAEIIWAMNRNDFREIIIKKVATSELFARVVCFGFNDLSKTDIGKLIMLIRENGFDIEITEEDLPSIIHAITERASSYK